MATIGPTVLAAVDGRVVAAARDVAGAEVESARVVGAARGAEVGARVVGVDEAAGASDVGANAVVDVAAVVIGRFDVAGADVPPPDEHAPRAIIAALTAATDLPLPLRLFTRVE